MSKQFPDWKFYIVYLDFRKAFYELKVLNRQCLLAEKPNMFTINSLPPIYVPIWPVLTPTSLNSAKIILIFFTKLIECLIKLLYLSKYKCMCALTYNFFSFYSKEAHYTSCSICTGRFCGRLCFVER